MQWKRFFGTLSGEKIEDTIKFLGVLFHSGEQIELSSDWGTDIHGLADGFAGGDLFRDLRTNNIFLLIFFVPTLVRSLLGTPTSSLALIESSFTPETLHAIGHVNYDQTKQCPSTLRRMNLKTDVSLWECIKSFPSTLRRRILEPQQSPITLDSNKKSFPSRWRRNDRRAFFKSSVFVTD